MKGFIRGKNQEEAFSRIRRRHEAELEQNQSRAPAGRSSRGNFPPGGGNRRHRHHQHSSRRRGVISINIFISTISSPNPSSSLVTNLHLATPIGTCKVASSVDYSLLLMLVGLLGGRLYVQIFDAIHYLSGLEYDYAL